jgi:hypothetical protein
MDKLRNTAIEILLSLDTRVHEIFKIDERRDDFNEAGGDRAKATLREIRDRESNLGVTLDKDLQAFGNALENILDAYDEVDIRLDLESLDEKKIAKEIKSKWPNFPEEKIPEYFFGIGNDVTKWELFVESINTMCSTSFEAWDMFKHHVADPPGDNYWDMCL